MSGRTINLPKVDQEDQDQTQDQGGETNASRLSAARAMFAASQDEQDRARLNVPEAETPNTLTGVPGDAATLPIAVRAQVVQVMAGEESRRQVLRRANANRMPGSADLRSRGDSPDVAGTVEIERGMIGCPNCGRSWPYRYNLAGSTIPCSGCGFLVEVPLPEELRPQVDALSGAVEDAEGAELPAGAVSNDDDDANRDPNAPAEEDQE